MRGSIMSIERSFAYPLSMELKSIRVKILVKNKPIKLP
jgi:hypothetical protein